MGVINNANIPQYQFMLLVGILHNIPWGTFSQYNLVSNIAQSQVHGNDIHIVRGVHYQEYDNPTQFHFNIRISNRGRLEAMEHHVYVYPYPENGQVMIYDDGTVELPNPEPEEMVMYDDGTIELPVDFQPSVFYLFHSIPTLMY